MIGLARDGFPIYGPVQNYSPSLKKVYLESCSDCILTELDGNMLDLCGGIEVADGDSGKRFDWLTADFREFFTPLDLKVSAKRIYEDMQKINMTLAKNFSSRSVYRFKSLEFLLSLKN